MATKTVQKTCNKYVCDICDYTTSRKSSLDTHLLSAKHEKKYNSNKNCAEICNKYVCDICDYTTSRKSSLDIHLLSAKHEKKCNSAQNCAEICNKYVCDICDYTTMHKYHMNAHMTTTKHKTIHDINQNTEKSLQQQFVCNICNKIYNDRSGLWRHMKKCEASMNESDGITTQMFCDMLKQNNEFKELIMKKDSEFKDIIVKKDNEFKEQTNEFKELIVEQNSKIMELSTKSTIINTNTNSNCNNNNNNFNLQFFLNDTCKDALNISDFINQLQVSVSDLEETGKLGYVEGISKIFINGLNQVETNLRPMHCSDSKREIIYIKNNNIWEKDNENKDLLTNAIKTVAHKNMAQIGIWAKQYPECMNSNSKYNNKYLDIVSNAMAGATLEETGKNYKKIAKNIAKETIIYKM